MQFLVGAFGTALAFVLSNFVPKLLFALGIGYISYQGADVLLGKVTNYVNTLIGGISGPLLEGWLFFGGDIGINMIMAAYTVRVSMIGARKLVLSGPAK